MKKRKLKIDFTAAFLLTGLLILSACGSRPSHVLSDKTMEDVLYDVYIADAEISTNYAVFDEFPQKKEELLESVFKKHKISRQQFDTSLVWYNANWERYKPVSDRVLRRLTILSDTLAAQERRSHSLLENLIPLREGLQQFFLTSADLKTKPFSFELEVDTSGLTGMQSYQARFDMLGLNDSTRAIFTFCALEGDSVLTTRVQVTENRDWVAFLNSTYNKKITKLYGSMHISNYPTNARIMIANFGVYRVDPNGRNTTLKKNTSLEIDSP